MSPRDPPKALEEGTNGGLQATAAMCHYCFDVLVEALKKQRRNGWGDSHTALVVGHSIQPGFYADLPRRDIECPLFVTWDKKRHSHFELRGCIGTLTPKPLASSIGEYALISALKDKRFRPVATDELPNLRVAVSLLIDYEECGHCHDWTVGIHGIIIRWVDEVNGASYSATYLPEVASDQGWDQKTAVDSLIRKAGFRGHVDEELLSKIECTRYQSSKHRVTFAEYLAERGHDESVLLALDEAKDSGKRLSPSNCVMM